MTELEWFGRTYRSPLPLPPGYWLAPLVALAVLAGSIFGQGEGIVMPETEHPVIESLQPAEALPAADQPDVQPANP